MGIAAKMTAGGPAPDQSLKNFGSAAPINVNAGNVTVNVYTPPAGKTYYITDFFLSGDFTVTMEFQIIIGGVTVLDYFYKADTAPISWPGLESQWAVPGGSLLAIKFVTAVAGKNASYDINGFEQTT